MVQENEKNGMTREDAIQKAVFDCINQNVLKEFLEQHRGEVVSMLLEEWNLKDAVAVAERDGEARGKRQQSIEIARNLRADGMGVDAIARATGLTVDDVLRL
jgi:predicted transposase/invertase (TIGR01784 family)